MLHNYLCLYDPNPEPFNPPLDPEPEACPDCGEVCCAGECRDDEEIEGEC